MTAGAGKQKGSGVARSQAAGPRQAEAPESAEPRPFTARWPDPLLLLVLLAGLGVWICFLVYTRSRLEDALITYRYAENLARGVGFVFNPGERVLGTTSPLQTLLLAAFARLFGIASIPLISNVLMLAASLATGALLYDVLMRGTGSRVAALAAAALWVFHPDTLWTLGGMETPLVVCLMVAGLDLALRDRWNLAAVVSGLLVLARADGLVWAVLLLLLGILRLRWRVLRPILVGLVVVAPWVLFAWLYFGSPVPHAIVAKHEIGVGAGGVKYLPWLLDSLGFTFHDDLTPIEFAVWLCLILAGAATVLFKPALHRVLRILAIFPLLFTAVMAWGRAPWFEWYLVPVTWCGLVLGVLGALEIFEMLRSHVKSGSWPRAAVPAVATFCGLVLALGLVLRDVSAFSLWRQVQENEDGTRRRIGEWIREHASPGATVATESIGYEGALSGRRVVDLAGVISPGVVEIYREGRSNAQTFERVLDTYGPEVVVLRAYEFERNRYRLGGPLFETPQARSRFLDEYGKAFEVTAPHPEIWGENASFTVWRRK